MQRNCAIMMRLIHVSFLHFKLPSPPTTDPSSDPWQEVEVPTADKHARPESEFGPIDCHPKDVHFGLEDLGLIMRCALQWSVDKGHWILTDGDQGEEIACGVNTYE